MAAQNKEGDPGQQNFDPAFDRQGIPLCLSWSVKKVENWMESLGFPQYKECVRANHINGRKLIMVDTSTLPKIGITDFEHMKLIARKTRELLGIEEPYWNRSISLPPREPKTLFLERKSATGREIQALTLDEHLRELKHFNLHGVPEKHFL